MSESLEIRVPDIGGFKDVPVIEVLVKSGDRVKKNDSLITLESEKASMEVPSESDGVVQDVKVKVGDKVSEGSPLITLRQAQGDSAPAQSAARSPAKGQGDREGQGGSAPAQSAARSPAKGQGDRGEQQAIVESTATSATAPNVTLSSVEGGPSETPPPEKSTDGVIHASPAIRRFARELGVDLQGVRGSGPHARITREDIQGFVKRALQGGTSTATGIPGLPPWPVVDFAAYGPVERKPLSRIRKFSGPNLHRNWLQIPHITNYDEADITELEAFRNQVNAEQAKSGGPKVTILAFLVKASVAALQRFPEFNASLDGDELVYKRYYNIGFAADTPGGLVVPVVKSADTKGLLEIARESAELAAKARDGKLSLAEMQGGTFTISSIGGIGGTAFTQIVNAPEVAILGAVRAATKPVWSGTAFIPRLLLPISVSYDHRVIDGAVAARFLAYLSSLLSDFRRVLL